MRNHLQQLGKKKRHRFSGTFVRTGYKRFMKNYMEYPRYSPTFLLKDVYLEDQLMTDHLWMNYGVQFVRLGQLRPNDRISFDARVDTYEKGIFPDYEMDYKLSRPTKVAFVDADKEHAPLPEKDKNALVGYIMEANKKFYVDNGRPYDRYFVDKYQKWQRQNGLLPQHAEGHDHE